MGGGDARGALKITLALNAAFLVVEVALGLWSGSLALLADAAHMVSDVGAIALAWGAAELALRPASPDRSYGWRRAETLGAFINGIALIFAAGFITKEAIERLAVGAVDVLPGPVIAAGIVGLIINLGSAWALSRADGDNLNIRGALAHMLADALGSAGAIASGVAVWWGYPGADPLISLFIVVIVLRSTWHLLGEASAVLLQFAPPGVSADEVKLTLHDVPGLETVHDLHVWTLDGRTVVLSAHLVAAPEANAAAVRRAVEARLAARYGAVHSTLQMEGGDDACAAPYCPLTASRRG
jgi:cobalt-zinc-cadmium efflux system protein